MERRHRHGKENQPPLNNGQTNSDATEPTTSEKRLKQKRKYFNRTYQEMSHEKKQALLLKNRAKKQQQTRQSSNSPIQSTTSYEATGPSRNQASASTPLSVRFHGASVIDPNRACRSSHGVQTCRKRIYGLAKNQPSVLIQQNDSTNEFDNITEEEINIMDWCEEFVAPVITNRCEDNYLLATDISTVHFNPQIPENEELRLRLNMP